MSEVFRIPSDRQPWLDTNTGMISRPWFLFLQGVFTRIGGATGTPVENLDIAIASDTADADQAFVFMQQIQELGVAPAVVQLEQQVLQLEADLSSTRDQIAELARTVAGIQAGTLL